MDNTLNMFYAFDHFKPPHTHTLKIKGEILDFFISNIRIEITRKKIYAQIVSNTKLITESMKFSCYSLLAVC